MKSKDFVNFWQNQITQGLNSKIKGKILKKKPNNYPIILIVGFILETINEI